MLDLMALSCNLLGSKTVDIHSCLHLSAALNIEMIYDINPVGAVSFIQENL
jgi:hypothetical protein